MVDARTGIQFEELGLGSVLKRYYLKVPPNQREYAWEGEHVTQLLQDFASAVSDDRPYFLGTIVTIPQDEGRLEVSDGQQRLATTAILLASIRDYLREKGESLLVQSIDNEFLMSIDRAKREPVPKLTLNVDDHEFFKQLITHKSGNTDPVPQRASHELLLNARKLARRQVERIVAVVGARGYADELERWISFIEYRALVVLLRVSDQADAFKMFETLNDRGLRTSQADLIKNYLFSKAESRMAEVQSRWSYMRGALESSTDDSEITINFLRHTLMLLSGHLREAAVYERVQDQVKSQSAAVTFADTLETLSTVYVATFSSSHERWNDYPEAARRGIEVLNLLDIKPLRPLMLAVGARMEHAEATKAFNFLIALGVRLMIASSTRSGTVEEPIADSARRVFDGTLGTAKQLRDQLDRINPTDAAFQEEFSRARVSKAKLARYYLRSLEMTAKSEPEPWFVPQESKQVINLEHVLPKRPVGNWPQFTDDQAAQYTTRLGNQLLLRASDNSSLKSQAFAEKKAIYAASPYILTSQVGDVDDWSPEAIEARQRKLAELAVRTWTTKV